MTETSNERTVRIDKWLWATRCCKTRTLAIEACKAGHVKINGQSVKPSHPVRPGETITFQKGPLLRTVRVLGLLEQRVGARIVPRYLEDLTPDSEYAKLRERKDQIGVGYPPGIGRPTKKQRRVLERFLGRLPWAILGGLAMSVCVRAWACDLSLRLEENARLLLWAAPGLRADFQFADETTGPASQWSSLTNFVNEMWARYR